MVAVGRALHVERGGFQTARCVDQRADGARDSGFEFRRRRDEQRVLTLPRGAAVDGGTGVEVAVLRVDALDVRLQFALGLCRRVIDASSSACLSSIASWKTSIARAIAPILFV